MNRRPPLASLSRLGVWTIGFPIAPKDQPKELYDFWECSIKGQPDYEMTDENGNYLHHTDKVDKDISKFLNQVGDQKPFCLSVSFKAPHVQDGNPKDKEYQDLSRQFIIQPRYKGYYQNVTIPVPETADPKYWESFPAFFQTEENIARERWRLRFETPENYQESVKNYYRLITGVDEVVGNMVKELEAILRQLIKMRGLDNWVSHCSQGVPAMVIGEQENDVGFSRIKSLSLCGGFLRIFSSTGK